jgi:hypothetical protein
MLYEVKRLRSLEKKAEHKKTPSQILADSIEQLNADFGGVSTTQEQQLFDAAAAGEVVIDDLEFALPAAAGPACIVLGDMLEEADDYCRAGQHLLTLASSDEVVRFRRWYLVEMVRQLDGAAPVPWPEYDGYWPTSR